MNTKKLFYYYIKELHQKRKKENSSIYVYIYIYVFYYYYYFIKYLYIVCHMLYIQPGKKINKK